MGMAGAKVITKVFSWPGQVFEPGRSASRTHISSLPGGNPENFRDYYENSSFKILKHAKTHQDTEP